MSGAATAANRIVALVAVATVADAAGEIVPAAATVVAAGTARTARGPPSGTVGTVRKAVTVNLPVILRIPRGRGASKGKEANNPLLRRGPIIQAQIVLMTWQGRI